MPLKRPFPPKKSSSKDEDEDDKKAKNLPPWLKKKPVKK